MGGGGGGLAVGRGWGAENADFGGAPKNCAPTPPTPPPPPPGIWGGKEGKREVFTSSNPSNTPPGSADPKP